MFLPDRVFALNNYTWFIEMLPEMALNDSTTLLKRFINQLLTKKESLTIDFSLKLIDDNHVFISKSLLQAAKVIANVCDNVCC
jgi:hypothetical protein